MLGSGLRIEERKICYLGLNNLSGKGQWIGYLVELNTKTLELKRSLNTKDGVW